MDILLTHGYFLSEDPHELEVMKPYPPLGILCISAYLKTRGYQVGVFDSTFRSLSEYRVMLERERPPVVGLYCNLMTRASVIGMIGPAKAAGAFVILGGPEPSNYADQYLRRGADVIVFGEGERALDELLQVLARRDLHDLEKITGIAFRRDDGQTVRTPPRELIRDLDSLPDPDREAIEICDYLNAWRVRHGVGSVSLICARGCPYQCTWCSHSVYGHTHRRRSPRRVAAEVESLLARYKPDQLWYSDDVFTIHHSWLFEYSDELKRRAIRIPFECISRADRLSEEVIDRLSEMSCYRLWLGSESGSQRILDAMRRRVKVEQVQSTARSLKRRGIQVGMFIMLGYEGETVQDLEETVDLIKRCAPDVFLTTVAYPIKGTEYYEKVEDQILAPGDWELQTDRDLSVRGRHSRRFYSFATRWMVNSAALERERQSGANLLRMARVVANSAVGKLGMLFTKHEIEGDSPARRATPRPTVRP